MAAILEPLVYAVQYFQHNLHTIILIYLLQYSNVKLHGCQMFFDLCLPLFTIGRMRKRLRQVQVTLILYAIYIAKLIYQFSNLITAYIFYIPCKS